MAMKQFTLTKKIELTSDVFELHFDCSEDFEIKPWQFVTFILPKIGGRAYSVLEQDWNKTVLIIKRVKKEYWWRGWSIFICDSQPWDILNWVWPAGHFVLTWEKESKLFIGTGTGLVPLYNQILSWLERWDTSSYTLLFWIRTIKDVFYEDMFKDLSDKSDNFSYKIYLSREEKDWYKNGYVTDFMTQKNIKDYKEAYICGASAMVDSAVEKLEEAGLERESIFTEKY